MKKRISLIAAVLMLATVALFMPTGCAACGDNDVSGHALAGSTWTSTQPGSWNQYIFNADGTGTRGLGVQAETFVWTIPGNGRVTINRDNPGTGEMRREQWNYSIDGNTLVLDSRQTDFNFTFTRVGGVEMETTAPPVANTNDVNDNENDLALTAEEQAFVGAWSWPTLPAWQYNFSEDGTGTRGTPEEYEEFGWAAEDGVLLIATSLMEEMWSYEIVDGLLTITSMQVEGMTYSYTRVG